MKFYFAPASSYSQRVLIALLEKQARFDAIEIDLFDAAARARYAAVNPFLKVPALETDEGRILYEACVCIEHVDLACPGPRLLPADPARALEVRFLERVVDVYLNAGRQALFDDSQRPPAERGGPATAKALRLLVTACELLEGRLEGRRFLAGDDLSLADCAAVPTLHALRLVHALTLPRLTAYYERQLARPSVARVLEAGRPQLVRMLASLRYPLEAIR
jgi:glutathione S-transferase